MEGNPAYVIRLVDAGAMLHQEGHHVHVIVNAGLERKNISISRVIKPLSKKKKTCALYQ